MRCSARLFFLSGRNMVDTAHSAQSRSVRSRLLPCFLWLVLALVLLSLRLLDRGPGHWWASSLRTVVVKVTIERLRFLLRAACATIAKELRDGPVTVVKRSVKGHDPSTQQRRPYAARQERLCHHGSESCELPFSAIFPPTTTLSTRIITHNTWVTGMRPL